MVEKLKTRQFVFSLDKQTDLPPDVSTLSTRPKKCSIIMVVPAVVFQIRPKSDFVSRGGYESSDFEIVV